MKLITRAFVAALIFGTVPLIASQVSLQWNDNSSNETNFKIERALAGYDFTQVAVVGANVTSYTDTGLAPSTGYWYRVRASNASGDSAYSNVITAFTPADDSGWSGGSGGAAPTITQQPVSQTTAPLSTVTFTVAATGNPSYVWYRDGRTYSNWTGPSLTIPGVTSNDNGTYTVVVSNSAGSVTSAPATLVVDGSFTGGQDNGGSDGGGGWAQAPVITSQPSNQTASHLGTVTFSVSATGVPSPSYVWYRNGITYGNWTGSTLTLQGVSANDNGIYTVVVSNSAGSVTSAPATLVVGSSGWTDPGSGGTDSTAVAPVITFQPSSLTTPTLGTATFSVGATGVPSPSYVWYRNGVTYSNWTGPTLTLQGVTANDNGTYTVVVSNSAGSVTSMPATLVVGGSGSTDGGGSWGSGGGSGGWSEAPVITLHPWSQSAMPLDTVTFQAAATGNPQPTFVWYRNGVTYANWTGPQLTLQGVTSNDSGTYNVVVSNSAGSVTSAPATLTVNGTVSSGGGGSGWGTPPVIYLQPWSQSVKALDTVTFEVAATGSPAPSYAWYRNGVTYPHWTGPTLTLTGVTENDSGIYTAIATNSAGSTASQPAALTVVQR